MEYAVFLNPPTAMFPKATGWHTSIHELHNSTRFRIAFKVKSTNNQDYRVRPVYGIVAANNGHTPIEFIRKTGDPIRADEKVSSGEEKRLSIVDATTNKRLSVDSSTINKYDSTSSPKRGQSIDPVENTVTNTRMEANLEEPQREVPDKFIVEWVEVFGGEEDDKVATPAEECFKSEVSAKYQRQRGVLTLPVEIK
ncbi:MSP (Major sperm protein) domain-containing protein [Ditylenchus destructor]|nr:MSP (Major sperm protein) domain-containing protein [Ditylenchus destructor]